MQTPVVKVEVHVGRCPFCQGAAEKMEVRPQTYGSYIAEATHPTADGGLHTWQAPVQPPKFEFVPVE